jgi:hypothetical protein
MAAVGNKKANRVIRRSKRFIGRRFIGDLINSGYRVSGLVKRWKLRQEVRKRGISCVRL